MKSLTRSELSKRIDRLFQTCRRYDGAWKKGGVWYNKCVTSGKVLPITQIQAGHWIGRSARPLRWDPINCHPQSAGDNLYKGGDPVAYSKWIIETYGIDTFNLYTDKYERWKQGKIPPFKMNELKDIYDHWLKEGRALEKKVGPLFPKSWVPFGPEFEELPQDME